MRFPLLRPLLALVVVLFAVPAFASTDPPTLDVPALLAFAKQQAWVPLAALVIGFLVRLLKSDTKIPFTIPSEYRRFAVVLLGIVAAALERIIAGVSWKDAALGGTVAIFTAFLGHYFLIDKLRDGKEIAIPGLIIPGAAPSAGAPVTIPPKKIEMAPMPPMSMLAIGVLALALTGCGLFFKALDLAADKAKCVVENQDLPNDVIFVKCAVKDPERYLDLLAESRAATKRALQRQSLAPSDAGPACVMPDAGAAKPSDASTDAAHEAGK